MVMGWLSPIGMRAATWCLTLVVMVCLVAALSAPAPVLGAQEIAILKSADIAAYSQAVAAFKDTMDPSVVYTEYNLRGDAQEGRKFARRIRASDASLVLAVGLKAALAAKLELVDVPVIFCMVLDPVRYELKAPNMTGILLEIPIERHLSTIRQALPAVRRIGVLFDPGKSQSLVDETRRQARVQGFELVAKSVASDKDVAAAAHGLTSQIDLLWLIPDSTVLSEGSLRFLMDLALEHNIPSVGFSSEFVRSGALLALSVSYLDTGRQAAQVARKFLNGEGSDLSGRLLAPNQTRITVNSKTARYLGLTIPPEIIRQAESIN
jgi:putative ABC transport system substrate-binding protein